MLNRPVEIYREAQDGGQDAVFLIPSRDGDGVAIGSVQCKHSSEAAKPLHLGDITPELDHIESLVQQSQADTYIFMTNMSVSAPVAMAIRRKLQNVGVRKAHVLGKQYLVRAIRSSSRLRALVPQVYGLGDLTSIIDERLSQQSRALLDHWIPKLKTYVPTRAHRSAVRVLRDHGIVLLLGNPSSGKSAIGAILSTIASDDPSHTVLLLTSPRDFEAGWNANDPGRFFWIDDAFGPNIMREDYVQDWASAFQKVHAAIGHGNKFLLTSRKHIYEAARKRLGQRNLPVFVDNRAIVDVGALSSDEKSQILYNHVNFGVQTQSWKTAVKPYLDSVTSAPEFLPGIAERLGDPAFTKSLIPREDTLVRFMREPREHLIDTVNALDSVLQAALLLIYVYQGNFNVNATDRGAADAVAELTGISLPHILNSLDDLKGSFLRGPIHDGEPIWSFSHPTIADALTEILREKPHMMAALLRGATIDTILRSFACEGAPHIQDALTIPATLNGILAARLLVTPDEHERNWSLFSFLAWRASDQVFADVVRAAPVILERLTWVSHVLENDPKLTVYGRAHRSGLLNVSLRAEAASRLERAVKEDLDLSFCNSDEMLELIPATKLLELGIKLRVEFLPEIESRVETLSADADLDEDPESHFEFVASALNTLEALASDEEAVDLIDTARRRIADEVKKLAERKAERDSEKEDNADWTQISATSEEKDVPVPQPIEIGARSIFDDVDR
ncbi:MAG: hypothetical protein RB191_21495 [Terriglobia bacterium]|nr:hypothetical protein [Terriglobia bacterium]